MFCFDDAEGFIAGGTAGVVVETALYPIDTIKTRLQAGRGTQFFNFFVRLSFLYATSSCSPLA